MKTTRIFLYSAGILLLLTGGAKLISACGGSALVLRIPDPVLWVPYRYLFIVVGCVEIAAGVNCLRCKRIGFNAGFVAWLASGFVAYRVGLMWMRYPKPCHCLGTLTQALHISPDVADLMIKCILVYLVIGSYSSLFWLWSQRRADCGNLRSQRSVHRRWMCLSDIRDWFENR